MYINIITPCSRPFNLNIISKSINIPNDNYRWIVVFDSKSLPNKELIPNNCEYYLYSDINSTSGNSQRNFAIDLVKKGYIYFNDDDTIIHSKLWENISSLDDDFISFNQLNIDGSLRLEGNCIKVCHIDSHNFIVKHNIIDDIRFEIDKYYADGIFAEKCFEKSITRKYINKPLSVYNYLR